MKKLRKLSDLNIDGWAMHNNFNVTLIYCLTEFFWAKYNDG